MKNPWEILDISPTSDLLQIKVAYRNKIKNYADIITGRVLCKQKTAELVELNAAYEFLKKPGKSINNLESTISNVEQRLNDIQKEFELFKNEFSHSMDRLEREAENRAEILRAAKDTISETQSLLVKLINQTNSKPSVPG